MIRQSFAALEDRAHHRLCSGQGVNLSAIPTVRDHSPLFISLLGSGLVDPRPRRPNGLERQRRRVSVGPLAHRAVVVPHPIVAEHLQDEESVRRTDSTLSIGDDLLVRRHAQRLQRGPDLGGGFEGLMTVVGHQVEPL